jgi:hypothetical protein
MNRFKVGFLSIFVLNFLLATAIYTANCLQSPPGGGDQLDPNFNYQKFKFNF